MRVSRDSMPRSRNCCCCALRGGEHCALLQPFDDPCRLQTVLLHVLCQQRTQPRVDKRHAGANCLKLGQCRLRARLHAVSDVDAPWMPIDRCIDAPCRRADLAYDDTCQADDRDREVHIGSPQTTWRATISPCTRGEFKLVHPAGCLC